MKKWRLLTGILAVLIFSSCQKEVSADSINNSSGLGTGNNDDYQPVSAGSEWNYSSLTLGDYTIKALGTDSTINGIKYYKFDNISSLGAYRFYVSKNDGVYNQATRGIVSGQFVDMVLLKDAAIGTTWTNAIGLGGFSNYHKYTISKKNIEHTVNNKLYSSVIELDYEVLVDDVMSGGNPVSVGTGKAYFAKGVGVIEDYYTADMLGVQLKDSVYLTNATIR